VWIAGHQQSVDAARAGGPDQVSDQLAGDPAALPLRINEQVLQFPASRTGVGDGNEANETAVEDGDPRPTVDHS
jgi:hypothetical protein